MKSSSSNKKGPTNDEAVLAKAYVTSLPRNVARGLRTLSEAIRAAAPNAKLGFSYGVPAYRLNGRPLVWFAAFEHHSSFFPGAAAIRAHSAELKTYKTSKGTIQFPHDKPPSARLVAKLVKTRVAELQKTR